MEYRDIAFRDATYIDEMNMSILAFYTWITLILISLCHQMIMEAWTV